MEGIVNSCGSMIGRLIFLPCMQAWGPGDLASSVAVLQGLR